MISLPTGHPPIAATVFRQVLSEDRDIVRGLLQEKSPAGSAVRAGLHGLRLDDWDAEALSWLYLTLFGKPPKGAPLQVLRETCETRIPSGSWFAVTAWLRQQFETAGLITINCPLGMWWCKLEPHTILAESTELAMVWEFVIHPSGSYRKD